MAKAERRTAVVFIHGVGVQDRYQQLTDFSDGLLSTTLPDGPRFERPQEDGDDRPLANFVPLVAKDGEGERAVEVSEIFWGPLLNGKTNPFSVLTWMAGLLGRSIALVNGEQATANITGRPPTSKAKWRYTIGYVSMLVLLAAAVFWTLLNGVVLALDQTTYLKVQTQVAKGQKPSVGHLGNVTPKSLGLLTGVDYGPGHILVPKGRPSLPFPKKPSGPKVGPSASEEGGIDESEGLVSRKVDLRLAPDGSLAPQRLVGDGFEAEKLGKFELVQGRLAALGAFLGRALTYLPTRDPNLPALGFADFVGGGGVFQDIELSQFAWGATFFVLAFSSIVFFGRAVKNARRLKNRQGREPADFEERKRADRAFSANFGAGWSFAITAMTMGNVVSHVAAYFLGSVALLRLAYVGFGYGLANIAGDVQVYVARNENSDKFEAREKVLNACVEGLWAALRSERYDDVVLAAHSLGSVVGLEAIRRIYAHLGTKAEDDPDALAFKKLRVFVTFGSPLEKTRLYFQRDDYKSRYAEFSQTIDLRIFRTEDPEQPCIRWVNYWMFDDIICDPLVTYPVDREVRVGYNVERPKLSPWPHSDYWTVPAFVQELADLVLRADRERLWVRHRIDVKPHEGDPAPFLGPLRAALDELGARGAFPEVEVPNPLWSHGRRGRDDAAKAGIEANPIASALDRAFAGLADGQTRVAFELRLPKDRPPVVDPEPSESRAGFAARIEITSA